MKEIIVGYGTHDNSDRPLEWAAALAKQARAKVAVVNVFHPHFSEMSHDLHEELVNARRTQISRVMDESGHADFEVVVETGEALAELLRFSEGRNADLIVVGRHGSMGPGGFGEGGAADLLLRKSRTPFVVVGDDAPLPNPSGQLVFIVGVDGSSANADSVNSIARIAGDLGARTIPVLSVNTEASTTRNHYGSHFLHENEATAIADRLPNSDPFEVMNDSPVEGLIEAAREHNADLIAIGTRGHRTFVDLVAGQIARHLIDHAPTAVMVAPHH